ncbi:MAG: AMP-binding protein [bacterium]|nr:AMP-binding protein [bacterium]
MAAHRTISENFADGIGQSLRRNWDVPCFSDLDGSTLSCADVARRIVRLHRFFDALDLRPGDRVGLVGRNSAHWAVVYLATVTRGAVIVPILPDFTGAEIEHIVRHSGCRALFLADAAADAIDCDKTPSVEAAVRLRDFAPLHESGRKAAAALAVLATPFSAADAPQLPADLKLPLVAGDSLATIVYTSGTTGFSKGVMLTHRALMVNVRFFIDHVTLHPADNMVSFLPLAHAFGCAFDFLAPFFAGCHITFIDKVPTPKVLLAAFASLKPVVVMSVPLIIEKIYRNRVKPQLESPNVQLMLKVPGLRALVHRKIQAALYEAFGGSYRELVVGGAALNRDIEQFFRKIGFNLTCGYGMTECGPLISYSVSADKPPVGSVGRVIPYLECRIDGAEKPGDIGEVLVRGENRMIGYFQDDEATAGAIDSDGWLHTGDLGRFDAEGFLYLTGRSKNMILTASGQNIYPEEIESRLNNMPCVEESLVIEREGRLLALVYPDLESVDRACLKGGQVEVRMEANRQELNQKLPGYAQIAKLKILYEEFEKTPTKKIKRRVYDAFAG